MMNEIGTFSLADKNLSEPISLSKQCYLVYNFEYIVKLGSWSWFLVLVEFKFHSQKGHYFIWLVS